jgi:hypothetical protein
MLRPGYSWLLEFRTDGVKPSQDVFDWIDSGFEAQGDSESVIGHGDTKIV